MSRRKKYKEKHTEAMTTDAFSNPLFRLGYGSQSPLEATEYPLTRMTDNYALLNSLYRDNWVVQNVVSIIPDDMTKKWFTLTGNLNPDYLSEFERVQRVTQLKDKINTGLRWGRLYGGAAALIMIKGQENRLNEPLDIEMVFPGTFQGLYILDRWSGITPDGELVTDMSDPDFGLPKFYRITDSEGNIYANVHHSRIIRFTGRELPYLEKLAELYWGESEIEALYADVVKHDNVSTNMAALTFRANVDTMEVQNLDQLFSIAASDAQRRFWATMQAQSVCKSNFGVQLVNKNDKITNTQYTFTGLSDVYDSMCLDLAGASRIPVTKLFGRSPAGLNSTGESDLQNYYDYIDTLRESVLKPIIYKLLPVLAMSAWGIIPDDIDITFPPLWTPSPKEVAEIAKYKAETIIATFQAGLIDVAAAQKELKKLADTTEMFDSISDEDISANAGKTFQDVTAMRDPLMGLGYEDTNPFDAATQDVATIDYSPNQPRDKDGKWTGGGLNSGGADEKVNQDEARAAFEKALQEGKISTKLNKDAQSAHKYGSEKFNERVEKGEQPSYTNLSNMEVQRLINEGIQNGKIVEFKNQFKITFAMQEDFGYTYNKKIAKYEPTNRATIHFSKHGTHLVPAHKLYQGV